MVGIAIGDNGNHSFLISDAGDRPIRELLRELGVKPLRPKFRHFFPRRLSSYELRGDAHLAAIALPLPRVTFGRLALFITGGCSLGYLFHQGEESSSARSVTPGVRP